MVSDSNRPDSGGSDSDTSDVAADGGAATGFDEAALYTVVHDAVKDALLDVIGTLLLVGVAFILVVASGQALLRSTTLPGTAVSVGIAAVGVYLAATALELVPPVRDWF